MPRPAKPQAIAAAALRSLYELWRAHDRKFSLAFFCRAAGIPSRGYLSDVFRGRRTLHAKYRAGVLRAFRLRGEPARFLRLLLQRADCPDAKRCARLEVGVELTRKTLAIEHRPMAGDLRGFFTALEVFCAFGLYKNTPTRAQLVRYFGAGSEQRVTDALTLLTSMQLIEAAPRGTFALQSEHFVLGSDGDSEGAHVEFLRLAMTHAAQNVAQWFPRKDDAYFASSVLSVRREHYTKVLATLRRQLLRTQADLESAHADLLVRFNVQVYPLRPT